MHDTAGHHPALHAHLHAHLNAQGNRAARIELRSVPRGADAPTRRGGANRHGSDRSFTKEREPMTGRVPLDHHPATARQRGGMGPGGARREPGTMHPARDRKTPGAPTPDVLESWWVVELPDCDPTVAKR